MQCGHHESSVNSNEKSVHGYKILTASLKLLSWLVCPSSVKSDCAVRRRDASTESRPAMIRLLSEEMLSHAGPVKED